MKTCIRSNDAAGSKCASGPKTFCAMDIHLSVEGNLQFSGKGLGSQSWLQAKSPRSEDGKCWMRDVVRLSPDAWLLSRVISRLDLFSAPSNASGKCSTLMLGR